MFPEEVTLIYSKLGKACLLKRHCLLPILAFLISLIGAECAGAES